MIENLINRGEFNNKLLNEAEKALKLLLQYNISKFNYQPNADISSLKGRRKRRVLLIDQTFNDLSVLLGMADKKTFFKYV